MSNADAQTDVAMSPVQVTSSDDQTNLNKDSVWPASTSANAKALKTVLVTIPDSLKSFLQGELPVTVAV